MNEKIFKLLVKKITNESLTDKEKLQLENELKNKDTLKEYKKLQKIYNKITWNKELANLPIEKLRNKILNKQKEKRKIIFMQSMKYAAIFIMFSFILTFLFSYKKTIIIANTTKYNKSIILPDNSEIILHSQASVSYKISLLQKFNRQIDFKGTGFFKIKHLNGKKFTVRCNDLQIQVLGTQFNVNQNKTSTAITLIKGKVRLSKFTKKLDTTVIMKPNEIVTYYKKTGKIVHQKVNTNIQTYWIKDKIIFNNYTMKEIAHIFKKYYGKTLLFDDSITLNKHIRGSAPTDNINLIIKALSIITKQKPIIKHDTIIFK
jgi:ferric-dicitrate binding protein FerR (iron transport regulator)